MSTSVDRAAGRIGAGLLLSLCLAIPCIAQAQADPDTVKLRNDCRLAAQVLSTGQPAPHRDQALATIGRCGAEGAAALVSLWGGSFADRAELVQWVGATRRVATDAMADRLFSIMADPSSPLDKRLATMMVMVTWVDPHALPRFEDLRDRGPEASGARFWMIDHATPVWGRSSLGPGFIDRLRSALEGLAASDPVTEMRAAAEITLRSPPLRPSGDL